MNRNGKGIGRTISVGMFSVTGARAMQSIAALISVPITIHGLGGAAKYGVWVTITSAITLLGFADLGIANGTARLVARTRGKNRKIGNILKTVLWAEMGSALIVMLSTLVLALILPARLTLGESEAGIVRQAILIKGFATAVSLPFRLGVPLLTGHQRYGLHVLGELLQSSLAFGGVLTLAAMGLLGIRGMAIVTGLSEIAGTAMGLFLAFRVTGDWGLGKARASWRLLRLQLGLGWASLAVTVSVAVTTQGTTFLMGMFGRPEWAAVWALASYASTQVSSVAASLGAPFATIASELDAQRKVTDLRKSASVAMKLMVGVITTATMGAFVFGEEMVNVFLPKIRQEGLGGELVVMTTLLLAVLTACMPMTVMRNILLGTKRHWDVARWSVASAIVGTLALYISLPLIGIWSTVLSRGANMLLPTFGLYYPAFLAFMGKIPIAERLFSALFFVWPVTLGLGCLFLHRWMPWTVQHSLIQAFFFTTVSGIGFIFLVPDFKRRVFGLAGRIRA